SPRSTSGAAGGRGNRPAARRDNAAIGFRMGDPALQFGFAEQGADGLDRGEDAAGRAVVGRLDPTDAEANDGAIGPEQPAAGSSVLGGPGGDDKPAHAPRADIQPGGSLD